MVNDVTPRRVGALVPPLACGDYIHTLCPLCMVRLIVKLAPSSTFGQAPCTYDRMAQCASNAIAERPG